MKPAPTTLSAPLKAPSSGESQPIANYGLLADCNSAALVDRDGSIDWLCLPRYDSDAVFARILDPAGGHWSIRPAGAFTSERRYLPGTLVVETTFTTDTGAVKLTDAMVFAEGQRGHDLGYEAPHELDRSVEGVSGEVELLLELAPRPEYGLIKPLVRLEDGLVPAAARFEQEPFRLLGVGAGAQPVAAALGHERGLEQGVGDRQLVVDAGCELEAALDVLARRLPVALAPVAARAPPEDLGAELVAGELRALGQRKRLREEAERGRDARELVAADAETEENVCAVEV